MATVPYSAIQAAPLVARLPDGCAPAGPGAAVGVLPLSGTRVVVVDPAGGLGARCAVQGGRRCPPVTLDCGGKPGQAQPQPAAGYAAFRTPQAPAAAAGPFRLGDAQCLWSGRDGDPPVCLVPLASPGFGATGFAP